MEENLAKVLPKIGLGLNPVSAIYPLCVLGQVTHLPESGSLPCCVRWKP